MLYYTLLIKRILLCSLLSYGTSLFSQNQQIGSTSIYKYEFPLQKLKVADSLAVAKSLEQRKALKKKIKLKDEISQPVKSSKTPYKMPIYKADGDFKMMVKAIDTTQDYRLVIIKPKGF